MPEVGYCWYFHLPSVSTDIEVRDHARGSLELLLSAHRKRRVPLMIAATASFLELCERFSPQSLALLREAIDTGIVSIAATYAYETDPFNITYKMGRALLEHDLNVKYRILGVVPDWFVPANFMWRPGTERHCYNLGIDGLILDSRHYAANASLRSWVWQRDQIGEVGTFTVPPIVDPYETRTLRACEFVSCPRQMRVIFRDWPATRALTFGTDAAIHSSTPENDILAAFSSITEGDVLVVVDDGDRIRGQSKRGYESLLDTSGKGLNWRLAASQNVRSALPPIKGLSTFIPAGVATFLQETPDAMHYWRLLNEIDPKLLDEADLDIYLALHDVFYVFWPDTARRGWYLARMYELLEKYS